MLEMPVHPDALFPQERWACFLKCEAQRRDTKEEPELCDNFEVEQYKVFWIKK